MGIMAGALSAVLISGAAVASPVTREIFFGVDVMVNGEAISFEEGLEPFIMDDRAFLSISAVSYALGYDISWDENTNTVSIVTDATYINPITSAEITALQVAWGEGLVAISTAYAEGADYATIAQGVLDTLYGYVDGTVLFKPTIAQEVPFRFTEASAASYFIGGSIAEDTGFALNPWTNVRFGDDGSYIINGETALWMGSVFLTNDTGEEIRVEKSLGLYRDQAGDVRIQLHHSSVPFSE